MEKKQRGGKTDENTNHGRVTVEYILSTGKTRTFSVTDTGSKPPSLPPSLSRTYLSALVPEINVVHSHNLLDAITDLCI